MKRTKLKWKYCYVKQKNQETVAPRETEVCRIVHVECLHVDSVDRPLDTRKKRPSVNYNQRIGACT